MANSNLTVGCQRTTTDSSEAQVANYHMVKGECDTSGTNGSRMNPHICDPHLATEDSDTRGETQAVLRRQTSRTNTQRVHQSQTRVTSTNSQVPNVTEDTTTTHNNNPIDQLAHAIERIAANTQPVTTPLLKPKTASTNIFDSKYEKFELFEDLFHTILKNATRNDRGNENKSFQFTFEERGPTTFKNIQSTSRTTLEEILLVGDVPSLRYEVGVGVPVPRPRVSVHSQNHDF